MIKPFQLFVQEPEGEPRTIVVEEGDTIGRAASNSIVLGDAKASKQHARIVVFEGRLAIEDLGSTNGIKHGSKRLESQRPHPLAHGDRFTIGKSTLEVVDPMEITGGAPMRAPGDDTDPPGRKIEPDSLDRTIEPDAFDRTIEPGPQDQTIEPDSVDRTIEPDQLDVTIEPTPPSQPEPEPEPAPRPEPAPAPQPEPTPQPQPAPVTDKRPEPIPKVNSIVMDPPSLSDSDSGRTMGDFSEKLRETDAKAFLKAVDVRLVFVVHREPRTERLTEPTTVIGRRSKEGAHITMGDDSVSRLHAEISFSTGTFLVKDLESTHGVSIAGSWIPSGGEQKYDESDTRISFGAVDAFLVIPPRAEATDEIRKQGKIYREALRQLSTDVPSAKAAIGAAEKSLGSGAHPGEQLIQAGAITVVQWTDAVRKARTWVEVQPTRSGPSVATLVAVVLIAIAAAAGVYYFLTKNGS